MVTAQEIMHRSTPVLQFDCPIPEAHSIFSKPALRPLRWFRPVPTGFHGVLTEAIFDAQSTFVSKRSRRKIC